MAQTAEAGKRLRLIVRARRVPEGDMQRTLAPIEATLDALGERVRRA
jgi:hypothetical protein